MNKKIFIIFSLFSISLSQDIRYIDEIFDNVIKTENVVYGNAPDLPFIFLFEWNTQDIDLHMDIYEPEGDTLINRPVIIFLHSGSFFSGSKEADDMVDLSIAAAKRGYVSISMEYRLGLNILSSYSGERAVYRGVQDASAGIRYLREFYDQYNIDPNKIFIWGSSAGSFIGFHLAYSEDDERPSSTFGDANDPDLGCMDCTGNTYSHNSKPNGLVSCWGAIGDLNWIEPEDNIPAIMFHGTLDPIVPIGEGYPFTVNITLPIVYGSSSIHNRLNDINIENQIYIGEDELHEYWGTLNGNWLGGPSENYLQIKNDAFNFLYNQLDLFELGDINQDNDIDVLDVVQSVNLILSNNYNELADMDNNQIINILDIVQLIELII